MTGGCLHHIWCQILFDFKLLCRVSPSVIEKEWITYISINSDFFKSCIRPAERFWRIICIKEPVATYDNIRCRTVNVCQLPKTFSTTHRTHPFFSFFGGTIEDSQRGLLAKFHGSIPVGSVRFTFPLRRFSRETGCGGWLPLDVLNSSFALSILGGADWDELFITFLLLCGLDWGGSESTAL